MLIKNKTLDSIIKGEISVIFRVWKRPTVKTGGTLTTRKGVLFIDSIEQIDREEVTEKDIKNAGLSSLDELHKMDREGDFYKITLHYHGEDPRIALRKNVGKKELRIVCQKLDKMGDWTAEFLRMIHTRPNIRAELLAETVGIEKAKFKSRVRRLKALGLTESLRQGYKLSMRGEKVLKLISKDRPDSSDRK